MGLGAWLAASTEAQHYDAEEARERREVIDKPAAEELEIYDILAEYDVTKDAARPLVQELCARPEAWVKVRSSLCCKSSSLLISIAVHDGLRAQT